MLSQIGRIFFFLKYFSGDAVFLCTLFVIFLALALYFGRGMIVSIILAFYPATFLFNTFPFMAKSIILSGDKLLVLNKIGVFFIFLLPLSIILNKYIFSESEYSSSPHILKSIGLSLSMVLLITLFSYSTVNFDVFHDFSPQIDILFNGGTRLFYWNLVPLALLAIL